jgi:hypothetical protein
MACPPGSSDTGRAGDEFARACGVVVCPGPETLGVRGVEAVAGGQAGDSGEDKVLTCLYRRPQGWGGLVAFRWGACGMGWVWGWGIVRADLRPHALLWLEFPVLSGEGPRDVLPVLLEFRFCNRPRPIPFASPKGEGVSGGGIYV